MKNKLHIDLSYPLKRLFRFALLLLFFVGGEAYAQNSSCPNADFELGNLTGWEGEIGGCCPGSTFASAIINGRHTIMTGPDTDPYSCGAIPVVAPGGTFSARLGNEQGGAEGEKLRYTMMVDASTSLFIYKYAVVLQDPGHLPAEQPRFEVKVLDEFGNTIDPACGEYSVVAGPGNTGFESCNNITYRNWTTVGLNLTAYIGQNITIEFMTGDCAHGQHFGYAYIDAYCSSLQINTAYCVGSSAAQLTAPIGFEYLWSTGETTQSITVQNAQQGDTFSCILTSPTGCQVTVSSVIALDNPIADFNLENTCYDNAVFKDVSQTFGSTFTDFSWDFGDGSPLSNDHNPVHAFPSPGNYTVTFTIGNSLGCTRSVTKTITVYPTPSAQIDYDPVYCTLTTVPQNATFTGTGNYTGGVFSSAPGLSLNTTTGAITPSMSQPGTYQVTYTIPTQNGCTVPPIVTTVKIVGSPTAQIHYPVSVFCQGSAITSQQPVLTGTGAYTNGSFSANPPGLNISQATGLIDVNSSQPGNYTVNYTIISQNECPNFVASASVSILSSPAPTTTLTDGIICKDLNGQTIANYTFDTGLGTADHDFEWFFEGNLITGATSGFYVADQPGNYSVIITNTITGCASAEIHASVDAVTVINDFTITIEEEFSDPDLIITVINGSGTYLYQLDGSNTQISPVFYNVPPGMHTVTVTDQLHCTNVSKPVFVLGYPRYFTPNGDGSNEYWRINTNNLVDLQVSIYDRFGKLLYTMKDNSMGWDGTYNGNRMPATDYWFIAKYRLKNSQNDFKQFRAHFSLKR